MTKSKQSDEPARRRSRRPTVAGWEILALLNAGRPSPTRWSTGARLSGVIAIAAINAAILSRTPKVRDASIACRIFPARRGRIRNRERLVSILCGDRLSCREASL